MARRKKKRPLQPIKARPTRVSYALGARARVVGVDTLTTPTGKGNIIKQSMR